MDDPLVIEAADNNKKLPQDIRTTHTPTLSLTSGWYLQVIETKPPPQILVLDYVVELKTVLLLKAMSAWSTVWAHKRSSQMIHLRLFHLRLFLALFSLYLIIKCIPIMNYHAKEATTFENFEEAGKLLIYACGRIIQILCLCLVFFYIIFVKELLFDQK